MSIEIGYYLVIIVDVLGQKNRLAELQKMPETDEEKRHAASVLNDTLGTDRGST